MTEQPTENLPKPSSKSSGSLIAVVALFISMIAVAISVFYYQSLLDNKYQLNNIEQVLAQNAQQQTQQIQSLKNQFNENTPTRLQNTLIEVTRTIHLANIHLLLDHDPKTALKLLIFADQTLRAAHSDVFATLHHALTDDMNALQAVPAIDSAKIFTAIEKINQSVQ